MISVRYFYKRIKLLIKPFFCTLVLVAIICAVCIPTFFSASHDTSEADPSEKINVGIVGDTENKLLKFGIEFLENADEAKNYINVVLIDDENKAAKMVENGDVVGCVFFSEQFLKSVTSGKNPPLKYITKKSTVDLASGVVNEVLETVSVMVVDIQTSAFTADAYLDSVPDFSEKKIWSKINNFLLDKVLTRESTVGIVNVSEKGISVEGYYFSSVVVIIVVLFGIFFAPYLIQKNMSLQRLLNLQGCNFVKQFVCESVSYILAVLLLCIVCFVGTGVILSGNDTFIEEISSFKIADYLVLLIKITPAIVSLCLMQLFVYSVCKNYISGVLLQFVVSIGLCYVSGCFYPSSFFPKAMVTSVNKLPLGNSFVYVQNALIGKDNANELVLCVLWCAILFFAAAAVRKVKIRSGE